MNRGVLAAFGCYSLWGILPIFWKWIQTVPALEILCHRIVWSFVALVVLLLWKKHWNWVENAKKNPKVLISSIVCAGLISVNWYTYIWAVNAGFIVETSLGYFINPLVTILLGMVFLKERLRQGQWMAIGVATLGVLYLTFSYGAFPWIGLTLAFSFGFYGLLRKTGALGALEGLTVETVVLLIPGLLYLMSQEIEGIGSFGHVSLLDNILLIGAGLVTVVPMLLFAHAARQVTMATLGVLQYSAPTIQFCIGVFMYHEPFNNDRLIGFSAIWVALAIYTLDSLNQLKKINLSKANG